MLRIFVVLLIGCLQLAKAQSIDTETQKTTQYIQQSWQTLTRSMTTCPTFADSKMTEKTMLYFPAEFTVTEEIKSLATNCHFNIAHLPQSITTIAANNLSKEYASGLLYLPNPYVVPGGIFNEMYGWDSYFIIRGLLSDGKFELAKGMVENFFFEIDHYGGVLNANRGYYLSRSQPPFLSAMVLSVYQNMKQPDLKWLEKAYHYIIKDYQYWMTPPHVISDIQLSRYYDYADGPIVETKEIAITYYREAVKYFLLHPDENKNYLSHNLIHETDLSFAMKLCDQAQDCLLVNQIGLSDAFYKSDRAIRESGLDITFRFGAFGAGTIDYAPVDLNSLLYLTEKNLQWVALKLNKNHESEEWARKANFRRESMNKLMWNSKVGLYFDYHFVNKTQSTYEYLSTFYPLWVGLASPAQAKMLREKLARFEQKGGLTVSTFLSGAQWDYPYGWAPLELIVVEGLHRYGYTNDANRIAKKFIATVTQNFLQDGTIREKYNVVAGTSTTQISFGYPTNEVGFGWTNGVFLTLLQGLKH